MSSAYFLPVNSTIALQSLWSDEDLVFAVSGLGFRVSDVGFRALIGRVML